MEDLTLREINRSIKDYKIDLEFWEDFKAKLDSIKFPSSKRLNAIQVNGGKHDHDPIGKYMVNCEEINNIIEEIKTKIELLETAKLKKLELLGQYEEIERQIIELRETTNMTWENISKRVGYCDRQCRRIYSKYKGERIYLSCP